MDEMKELLIELAANKSAEYMHAMASRCGKINLILQKILYINTGASLLSALIFHDKFALVTIWVLAGMNILIMLNSIFDWVVNYHTNKITKYAAANAKLTVGILESVDIEAEEGEIFDVILAKAEEISLEIGINRD